MLRKNVWIRFVLVVVTLAARPVLLQVPVLAQGSGVQIETVVPGGPAATAGLLADDRIMRIGGIVLGSAGDIDTALDGKAPGDKVDVVVIRGTEELTLRMVLGAASDDPARPLLGIMLTGNASMPVPRRPVSAQEKSRILTTIASQLREGYVFEEKGQALADRIESDLAAGLFDRHQRLDLFVAELTPYLYEMSNDKHLRVRGAAPAGRMEGEPRRRVVKQAPDSGAHGPGAVAMQRRPTGPPTQPRSALPMGAFGFERHEMLEGNIGYLSLLGFSDDPASKAAADEAMMAIEGADAVILDLRMNGGGAPFMVRYLSAFFFAEPTHLASTMMRGMPAPAERWTLHDGLPTRAFVDKPLYILTSRRTFSAAESFTFGLKINHRITQVGERTGGGGHFGETVRLSDEIELFLPTGRTYDPKTGEGWEAEGLEPDIEVPAREALDAALEAARAS